MLPVAVELYIDVVTVFQRVFMAGLHASPNTEILGEVYDVQLVGFAEERRRVV